jgi:hypothetical protein
MLVAMVDVMAGPGVLAPVAWAAALAGLSLWPAVALRRGRGIHSSDSGHAEVLRAAMAVHRSASLLLMAALTLVAGTASPAVARGTFAVAGHDAHGAAAPIMLAIWVASSALTIFTVWLIAALARQQRGHQRVQQRGHRSSLGALLAPLESASMAASILMMTIALTIG